jgi:hypothetical protein
MTGVGDNGSAALGVLVFVRTRPGRPLVWRAKEGVVRS